MIIEAIKAFIFGVVEGITEWLPISSTGHMMLLEEFVKLDVSEAFYSTFLVVIQLGAILAVILPPRYLPQYYKVQQWALPIFMIVVILLPQIIGFNPIGWYLNATAGSLLDLLL